MKIFSQKLNFKKEAQSKVGSVADKSKPAPAAANGQSKEAEPAAPATSPEQAPAEM